MRYVSLRWLSDPVTPTAGSQPYTCQNIFCNESSDAYRRLCLPVGNSCRRKQRRKPVCHEGVYWKQQQGNSCTGRCSSARTSTTAPVARWLYQEQHYGTARGGQEGQLDLLNRKIQCCLGHRGPQANVQAGHSGGRNIPETGSRGQGHQGGRWLPLSNNRGESFEA